MRKFENGDIVVFSKTSDTSLDGRRGIILGKYADLQYIVMFYHIPPAGYDPAIVISETCLGLAD